MRVLTAFTGLILLLLGTLVPLSPQPGPRAGSSGADKRARDEANREWMERAFVGPDGTIDPLGHLRALEQREQMLRDQPTSPQLAGVTRVSWSFVGPTNHGGRVRALVVHPLQPDHMLAASDSGGMWKTTNGGQSWRAIDDYLASMSFASLVLQPGTPDVVYAGSGLSRGFWAPGLLRSTDFGETWTHMAATVPLGQTVRQLVFTPDGSVLFAATYNGLWRVPLNGAAPVQLLGSQDLINDVAVAPDGRTMIATRGRSVLRSPDLGQTWQLSLDLPTTTWFDRSRVAIAPSNPSIVYALDGQGTGALYRSTDGGRTFTLRSSGAYGTYGNGGPIYMVEQGWHNLALWVNPRNPDVVVMGAVGLIASTNGGTTWFSAGGCSSCPTWPGGWHDFVDFHAIVAHPRFDNAANQTIYVGFDQGVARLDLYYLDVVPLTNGLGVMQFYAAGAHEASGVVIAGAQDNGIRQLLPGDQVSRKVWAGDGMTVAVDQRTPGAFYFAKQYLTLGRANVGSTAATVLTRCSEPDPFQLPDACTRTAAFGAPIALDPSNPDRLYAGGLRLWVTDNASAPIGPGVGPVWRELAGVPNAPVWSSVDTNHIVAIAVSPVDPNVVWVARSDADVYRTSNALSATPSWQRVDRRQPGGDAQVMALVPGRDSASVLYMARGGYVQGSNVWITRDGGSTWSPLGGVQSAPGLSMPVFDLEVYPTPTGSHWLYAGTSVGLFTSEDGGLTWNPTPDGPAATPVYDLFWRGRDLYAATHGRGLWKATVPEPTPPSVPGQPEALAARLTGRSVTFSWTPGPGAGATNHILEAGSVAGSTNIARVLTNSSAPGFAVPNVPDGRYFVRVRATNGFGPSSPSNDLELVVSGCAVPSPPGPLAANVNATSVTFTWGAAAGADSYVLEAGSVAGASNLASIGVGGVSFAATAPPGTYHVRVRGANACGTGAASNELPVTLTRGPVPGPPAALAFSIGPARTVALSWAAPATGAAPTGYVLEAGSAAGLANLAVVPVATPGYVAANVPQGTYYVRVRATNASGTGPPTSDVMVSVP